jgi:PTS system N-acetylglucosamine-specific IIC component
MLPIAVLPIAGLLLRVGQPDLLNWTAMAAAGDAIFSNLGLLFAVGVGVGLARENHGAAGLAALVCYLVTTRGVETMMQVPPGALGDLVGSARELAVSAFKARELSKLSIPVGLISGIIAGLTYNRYSNLELPSYLSFFGGRRFVAIATGLAGLVLAVIVGTAWPVLVHGMDVASRAILGAGSLGLFAYGVLNRLLIVTGLHHILNNFAWFIVGDYHGATGDLKRFFAGDPTAGVFMSGFFPVMMFGLPGACLAMYHAARPERRAAVAGLLLSLALTSFLTGVTEPIEFTFIFLAPLLYAVHAVATGLAMVLMNALGVRLGFSFSAGLFDYVLNFSHAQRPWLLIPVGLGFSVLYYGMFRYCIARFDLATPGREKGDVAMAPARPAAVGGRAGAFITALGGAGNLTAVEACTTRLRLVVKDGAVVDEPALRQLGARGIVRPSASELQVVLGPIADQIAGEIRAATRALPAPTSGRLDAATLLAALGGRANIVELDAAPGRLLLQVAALDAVDDAALASLGVRGTARPGGSRLHVLIAGPIEQTLTPLRALLAGS